MKRGMFLSFKKVQITTELYIFCTVHNMEVKIWEDQNRKGNRITYTLPQEFKILQINSTYP